MKALEKGRKFQMRSLSLFFQEHLGFPLLEILAEKNEKEDVFQMFLLNCPRPLENGANM